MKTFFLIGFIFFCSTLVFDLIHFLLHHLKDTKIGRWHLYHHDFFDGDLIHHTKLWNKNFFYHQLPELIIQLVVTSLFLLLFEPLPILLTLGMELLIFFIVVLKKGRDPNHSTPAKISRPKMNFYVFPSYHHFHHRYPDSFFSSWFRFNDLILGTSTSFKGRNILLTGSQGELGKNILAELNSLGAKVEVAKYGIDFQKNNLSGFTEKAKNADILILCHGSKNEMEWSHLESNKQMVELFLQSAKKPIPEIWGVGSEIEFHPALKAEDKPYEIVKRNYATYAKELYKRDDIIYRHLVPAAFTSPYGKGLVKGKFMTKLAFFFIKRGCRYVPMTYTGMAYANYFKFKFTK